MGSSEKTSFAESRAFSPQSGTDAKTRNSQGVYGHAVSGHVHDVAAASALFYPDVEPGNNVFLFLERRLPKDSPSYHV